MKRCVVLVFFEGGLQGVGETVGYVGFEDQAVDYYVDPVLFVAVQVREIVRREVVHLAVDAAAGVAFLPDIFDLLAVLAVAAANYGRQELDAGSFWQLQNSVDYLLHGLLRNLPPAVRAVRAAYACVEEAQIIIDFGDRANRGARVAAGGLLVNRNCRAKTLNVVDVGLVHLAEELAGVSGERFYVAALTFGVEGIEGQGTLAGAREAGDNYQLISRDFNIYVLEVLLPRAVYNDP